MEHVLSEKGAQESNQQGFAGLQDTPPEEPPRTCPAIEFDLSKHLKKSWRYVLAACLASVVVCTIGIRLMFPKMGVGQITLILVCVIFATLEATYCCKLQHLKRRRQLFIDGIATRATIDFIGIRRRGGKYAWVAEWNYQVGGTMRFGGVTPLGIAPNYREGDEIWIVYDADDPKFAMRLTEAVEDDVEVVYEDELSDDPRLPLLV